MLELRMYSISKYALTSNVRMLEFNRSVCTVSEKM